MSTSQPSIGSSRSNRGKAINAGLSSSSSPARLLNSNVQQETSALARSSRGSGRIRSSSDLQPIMPLPTAVPSPSTLVPRPILPQTDSSTLLAQLLTSSNQPSSTTLVLTSDPSTSRYVNHSIDLLNGTHSASFFLFVSRLPIIFPVQTTDNTSAQLDKSVKLMASTFNPDLTGDRRSYKQEHINSPNAGGGNMTEEPAASAGNSRSRSSDGERTQYRVRLSILNIVRCHYLSAIFCRE